MMVNHTLLNTISTPSPITSLASNSVLLAAGSADGSIRLYGLPDIKVQKAIRGLPDEVASLVFEIGEVKRRYLWAASGTQILQFDAQIEKMIIQFSDVSKQLDLSNTLKEDDVINKLDANKTHLAFSTDAGIVGVFDLSNYSISYMSKKHEQLCDALSFIPGFSRELISGGYDYKLMHHHYLYKTLLAQHDITTTAPPNPETSSDQEQIALAPPFIHCIAVSDSGLLAAGTADGRLVIGLGSSARSSKKSKKWEGLRADDMMAVKAADGPIVGLQWITSTKLVMATLSGNLKIYDTESKQMESIELNAPSATFKVNNIALHGEHLIVAGLDTLGKGIADIIVMSYVM